MKLHANELALALSVSLLGACTKTEEVKPAPDKAAAGNASAAAAASAVTGSAVTGSAPVGSGSASAAPSGSGGAKKGVQMSCAPGKCGDGSGGAK